MIPAFFIDNAQRVTRVTCEPATGEEFIGALA